MNYGQFTPGGTQYGNSVTGAATPQGFNPSAYGYGSAQTFQMQQQQPGYGGGGQPGAAAGGGSITGYDAAVYAAATSYLQSKQSNSTRDWMKKNPPEASTAPRAGVGQRPNPSYKQAAYGNYGGRPHWSQVPPSELHYCEVCKISCAGPQTYKEHLEGSKHKKREALEAQSGKPLPRTRVSFKCELCAVACTGQDTYNAHVKGSKHQKTVALHKKLGKPIPTQEPVVIAPAGSAAEVKQAIGKEATKRVVGVPSTKFVSGSKLVTTAQGTVAEVKTRDGHKADADQTAAALAAIAYEEHVQPVGENYVETQRDPATKQISFYCKLCDCKFTDANAKTMHVKGRRHRMSYKKKVDPSIEVDVKPQWKSKRRQDETQRRELMRNRQQELWSVRAMYSGNAMAPLPGAVGGPPLAPFAPTQLRAGPRGETQDDQFLMRKHQDIYPTEEELDAFQKLVIGTEKALKTVSDKLHNEAIEQQKKDEGTDKSMDTDAKDKAKEPERFLKGVMRVGLLAKGLLLKGDKEVQLVVLCSKKPTGTMLKRVTKELEPLLVEAVPTAEVDAEPDVPTASVIVTRNAAPEVRVRVTLTCTLHREENVLEADETNMTDAERADLLDKAKCLEALAELRHAKWFQARCANLQPALIILRIMRDICQRITTWTAFPVWGLELLVEKVLSSAGQPLSPGDAFRRVFEAVSSGLILRSGPGLLDPCEKEVINAVATMKSQRREDITCSAQHALRLIAFNQLHKILSLPRQAPEPSDNTRKRADPPPADDMKPVAPESKKKAAA